MVFVKDTSLQEAEAKAEQLCTNVQKTLSGDGAVIVVTLSVGMAVTGKDGYDYSTLFERADHAMYHICLLYTSPDREDSARQHCSVR